MDLGRRPAIEGIDDPDDSEPAPPIGEWRKRLGRVGRVQGPRDREASGKPGPGESRPPPSGKTRASTLKTYVTIYGRWRIWLRRGTLRGRRLISQIISWLVRPHDARGYTESRGLDGEGGGVPPWRTGLRRLGPALSGGYSGALREDSAEPRGPAGLEDMGLGEAGSDLG